MKDQSDPAQLKNSPSVRDAGSGYRLLAEGAVIQKGDDVLMFGEWHVVRLSEGDTMKARDVGHYRRKLRVPEGTPPAGYRWLVEGEEIRPGDRYMRRAAGDKLSPPFPEGRMSVFAGGKVGDTSTDFSTDFTAEPWVRPVETAEKKLTRKLASATAKIAGQKRAADSANREIVRLRASAADLQTRLEAMQKNARGNTVLVRKDGFSLPLTIPGADAVACEGSVFHATTRKDGFGRQVFKQV